MAVATRSDFVELIVKSGLVHREKLITVVGELSKNAATPRDVAAELVDRKCLTGFQANQLLAGKYRGFFLGKYKLFEILGSGGMGSVFLAEQLVMRRYVAIKVLPAQATKHPQNLERFYREARAAAALNHPNIVRAYDIDNEGNIHFLVMEYVDGVNLHQLLERKPNPAISRVVEFIRQTALGLQHIHENGLIHRDIKPSNLLLTREGVIRILDLGLARFDHTEGEAALTKELDAGKVLGTADFLSPEQAMSSAEVDHRSDIYSLGASLYYLLAGRAPFSGSTVVQKLVMHQLHEPPALESLRSGIPEDLLAIVRKMMAKKPEDRYSTAKEVYDALAPWSLGTNTPPSLEELPMREMPTLGISGTQRPTLKTTSDQSQSNKQIPGLGTKLTRTDNGEASTEQTGSPRSESTGTTSTSMTMIPAPQVIYVEPLNLPQPTAPDPFSKLMSDHDMVVNPANSQNNAGNPNVPRDGWKTHQKRRVPNWAIATLAVLILTAGAAFFLKSNGEAEEKKNQSVNETKKDSKKDAKKSKTGS